MNDESLSSVRKRQQINLKEKVISFGSAGKTCVKSWHLQTEHIPIGADLICCLEVNKMKSNFLAAEFARYHSWPSSCLSLVQVSAFVRVPRRSSFKIAIVFA